MKPKQGFLKSALISTIWRRASAASTDLFAGKSANRLRRRLIIRHCTGVRPSGWMPTSKPHREDMATPENDGAAAMVSPSSWQLFARHADEQDDILGIMIARYCYQFTWWRTCAFWSIVAKRS